MYIHTCSYLLSRLTMPKAPVSSQNATYNVLYRITVTVLRVCRMDTGQMSVRLCQVAGSVALELSKRVSSAWFKLPAACITGDGRGIGTRSGWASIGGCPRAAKTAPNVLYKREAGTTGITCAPCC